MGYDPPMPPPRWMTQAERARWKMGAALGELKLTRRARGFAVGVALVLATLCDSWLAAAAPLSGALLLSVMCVRWAERIAPLRVELVEAELAESLGVDRPVLGPYTFTK